MPFSLQVQLRATYRACRQFGLIASEAYAIALASVRVPARRAHYVAAFRHLA